MAGAPPINAAVRSHRIERPQNYRKNNLDHQHLQLLFARFVSVLLGRFVAVLLLIGHVTVTVRRDNIVTILLDRIVAVLLLDRVVSDAG